MRISDWSADVCSSDLGEGIATQLDPQINMWDVSAPCVRAWVRDELGPEAALADRIREDAKTLLRLPGLLRRLEEKFPPRGGAPEPPPLPDIELLWESRASHGNSEERRVGKECCIYVRSRVSPFH